MASYSEDSGILGIGIPVLGEITGQESGWEDSNEPPPDEEPLPSLAKLKARLELPPQFEDSQPPLLRPVQFNSALLPTASGGGRSTTRSGGQSTSLKLNRSTSRGTIRRTRRPTAEDGDDVDARVLDTVQQRKLQARRALRQLRSPAQTQTWTPEHQEIISSNIDLLMNATRDPLELGSDNDENRRRGRPTKKSTPGQGTKRSHSRSKSGKLQTGLDPNPESGTEGHLKRLRIRSLVRVPDQPLPDFPTLNPQPIQSVFPQHPLGDRSDEWFVNEFRKLFRRIEKFLDEYFCIQNLDEGEFHQPWAINHTPEFLNYVLQVAEQDPEQGGWDKMLRDTNQRKWLLMGMLMRILEVKVFGGDLWGATKEEKELMFGLEKALIAQEGFTRTNLRYQIVRTILGSGPVTKNFHSEVAKLTAQVSLLLKPLTDYMYAIPPPQGQTIPLIWDQYQYLHNIISSAAYLSLCIRLSPTIFYFTRLSPNEAFQPDDQHCLESEIFTRSKQKIVDNFDALNKQWNEKKTKLEADLEVLGTGASIELEQGKQLKTELAAHLATRPRHFALSYRALSKIGAWPNIRRFKPGSIEQEEAGIPLEQRTGCRIYDVSKSAGVFYFGIEGRAERAKRSVCLRTLVASKQKEYGAQRAGSREAGWAMTAVPYVLAVVGTAAIPYYFLAERFSGLTGDYLGEILVSLAENLRG